MLELLTPAGVLAITYLFTYSSARRRHRLWRTAAEAAGVTDLVTSRSFGIKRRLSGRFGSLRVNIERYGSSKVEHGIRIEVDGLDHGSQGFALRREGMGSAVKKALGGREIEVGDPTFDALAYVQGAPHVARAILDAETRALVGPLIGGRVAVGEESRIFTSFGRSHAVPAEEPLGARVSVSDGTLRAELPGSTALGGRFPDVLRTLLAAAQRLATPEDIPERLANNTLNDTGSEVRLANMLTLVREYPDHPRTRETLREACTRGLGEVRLRAAMELGEEGREVLLEIATRRETDDSRSARAVDALREGLTAEQAERILQRSLRQKRRATALAAARALGRIGGARVVPPLVAVLDEKDEEIVAVAATALGESGAEEAEGALIGALRRESPGPRASIAEALGRVGSAAAVPPLRELASQHPLDLGLRRTSRQAIAEIQSRLVGATPGQLALAESGSGQLSLAEEDAQGWVSLEGEHPIEPSDESPVDGEDASSADPGPPPLRRRETE